MAITISDAGINVNIVRETRSPSQKGFGALVFITTVAGGVTPAERIKLYSSLAGLAVDYASTDEAYKAGASFFSQVPAPTEFYVGKVDGDGFEAYADALDAMVAINPEFYCVTVEASARDTVLDIDAIASWVEASQRVFFNVSNDILCLDISDNSDIMSALKTSGYDRTVTFYSSVVDDYIDTGSFAILATTSYTGTDTLKTLKFKNVVGVTSENIDAGALASIKDKNGNVLYETASIRMIDDGRSAGGSWIDEVVGADALAEEIRVRVFGLLSRTSSKVPYNEKGMGLIEGEVEGALVQYVNNGYLSTAVSVEGDILPAYKISHTAVILASVPNKSARIAPDVEFTARLAGAIHEITIAGILRLD